MVLLKLMLACVVVKRLNVMKTSAPHSRASDEQPFVELLFLAVKKKSTNLRYVRIDENVTSQGARSGYSPSRLVTISQRFHCNT